MKQIRTITIALVLACLSLSAWAQDEAGPDISQNAALRYWAAFVYLPTHGDERLELLREWDTIDIEAAREQLEVSIGTDSLDYLHWASELDQCVWAINRDAGPYALMPHLSHSRVLAQLGLLRARVRLHDGDSMGAAEDIVAVMKLGRAFDSDLILISSLVGMSIESKAVEWVAANLASFDKEAVGLLLDGVAALPDRPAVGLVIHEEQVFFLAWWEDRLREADDGGLDAETLAMLANGLGIDDPDLRQIAEDVDQWLVWVEEAKVAYDEAGRVADLPYAEYCEAIGEFEANFEDTDNQVINLFLPSVRAVRHSRDRAQARLAMFRALLSLKAFGMFMDVRSDVLQDPYGDGMFEYILGGSDDTSLIGLRSELTDHEGNQVELHSDSGVPTWAIPQDLGDFIEP